MPIAMPICLTLFIVFVLYVILSNRKKPPSVPYFTGCCTLDEMITKMEDDNCGTPCTFTPEDLNAVLVAAGGRPIATKGTRVVFAALYLAALQARGK